MQARLEAKTEKLWSLNEMEKPWRRDLWGSPLQTRLQRSQWRGDLLQRPWFSWFAQGLKCEPHGHQIFYESNSHLPFIDRGVFCGRHRFGIQVGSLPETVSENGVVHPHRDVLRDRLRHR